MANEYDDYFNESRQQALTSVVAPADEDDPEKAARAISLGQTTGVAPELIYPNVENFEKQHQAVLNSDLITKNARLQGYLNSDPMAAKVSQDDVGHLDQVSELLHQFGYGDKPANWLQTVRSYTHPQNFERGFWEGFGEQPVGQIARDYYDISHDAFGSLGWHLATDVPEIGFRSISGLFHGIAEVAKTHVAATGKVLGLDGESLSKDIAGMFEAEVMGMSGRHGMPAPEMVGLVRGAVDRATPYLADGRLPPTGVHPLIDSVYKVGAERDAKILDDLVKESATNATRERSPEYYSKFVDQQLPDGPKIKVDASAIARLYGDKPPEPDDGILGWVPNLAQRLDTTAGSGGYIEIPLKDWLAHVDPEVHKELRDDILIRDHGFTVNEAKEVPDWKPEVTETQKVDIDAKEAQPPPLPQDPARTLLGPTQVLRGGAGLEPLFSVGDRKITLQRMKEKPGDTSSLGLGRGEFHDFDLLDQDGKKVGSLNLSEQQGGKQIYVEMVQAGADRKMYDPNFLGPALVRSLLRQLKEAFPNAESITGHRVSGAREKADSYMQPSASPVVKFDLGDPSHVQHFRDLLSAHWEDVGSDVQALFRTDEKGLAADSPLGQMVIAEMRRISPHTEIDVAHGVAYEGRELQGAYLPLTKEVIVSLNAKDPVGTAKHESIHALRRLRMFTEDEWSTLEAAVLENKWEEKYDIGARYTDLSRGPKIEEAIAEAYGHWRAGEAVPDKVHTLFERIKSFFEGLLKRVGDHLGLRGDSWEEIFQKIDSGEIGNRDLVAEDGGKVEPKFQEGNAPEPQQITLPFGDGKTIGIRQDIYQRWMRLIRQKHETDLKADFGDAMTKEKRTQTKEWRENAVAIREQVESSIDERPNILVDRLLSERAGELKIDPMSLREDLREVLPREYLRKTNSMSADDLAGYFGYPSGDALVEHLAQITEDRKASGLSHAEYVKKLVNDETNRQMEAQFGFLEKNILEEAKDRALSDNQISIIEEEVLALAEQAKQSAPIQRGAILSKLRESFSETPVGSISSDLYLKASGKAGRETEEALLKGDYQEAFQAKQRQWLAITQAKWAHAYEKQRKQLDKIAKQWSKKEAHINKEVAPEFVNHLQDQLRRAGYPGSRSLENIKENLAGQTLQQFAEEHLDASYGYRDFPVAEFALDPTWKKPVDALTHEEFTQFKGMIDALAKNGRDIYKFGKEGDRADLESAIEQFRQGIAQDYKPVLPEYGERPGITRTFAARLTSMPTVFNLFDRLDRSGPWNGLARRFLDQDAESIAFSKEVERAWKEVADYGDLAKKIAPPPMMPKWGERYGSFTRQNLLGLIQNAGNRSNWFKTARGWDVDPDLAGWGDTKPGTLWSWMIENSVSEDWARAQAMGDKIFKKVVERTDRVEENVNGYTLDKLPLEALEVDHGEGEPLALKGWYHPLIPDQIWYAEKGAKKGVYNDSPYGHIMTSNGYTRTRTGAIYPVDLGYGMLPARIGQMIHDITHRELVLDAQKVMLDPRVKNDITKYWGKEYTDLMEPYLREIAGQSQMPSANFARMEAASEFLRQNTMTTYIGFNPSTPMKHFPTAFFQSLRDGKGYFLKAYMQQWMGLRPNEGNYWGQYAMDHSEVLQGRDRHWREALGNNLEFPKADFDFTNWRDWRNEASRWGSKIVAWSDMASAKSLWIGQYQRYLADGINARDSISRANQDVIRQHGALLLSNKPELVRQSGNLHGWMTSVYGFMGERFQRLREAGFQINDTWNLMEKKEYEKATAQLPSIAANYLTYVVQVGLWEEAATTALSGDHKSGALRLFDLAFGNIASSIIYARDIWHAAETGQDPGTGLLTSAASDLNRVVKDLFKGKDAFSKQHAGKTLRDIITMGGITTGITPRQFGNVIKFPTDVYNRQQYPKDVVDWFRGLAKGQMPKKEAKK